MSVNRQNKAVFAGIIFLVSVVSQCNKPSSFKDVPLVQNEVAVKTDSSAQPQVDAASQKPLPTLPLSFTVKDQGFKRPGTVIVDEKRNMYLVSNAGEDPYSDHNAGFISRVNKEGKVVDLKWIEGGKKGAVLTAPKGMAIRDEILYVADVKDVRKFDLKSGKPIGSISFEKATFLNDIAPSPNGLLYVSDTGLTPLSRKLIPTETDCIYTIDRDDRVSTLLEGTMLKQPNGLLAEKDGVYAVSFIEPKLEFISLKGEFKVSSNLDENRLDGIVRLPDGSLVVSAWRNGSIYRGMPDGPFSLLITHLNSPGDFIFDEPLKRLVIPLAKDNALLIQPLDDAFKTEKTVASILNADLK
jgi:sugar lactone lactonase YvrE